MRNYLKKGVLLGLTILAAACASQNNKATDDKKANADKQVKSNPTQQMAHLSGTWTFTRAYCPNGDVVVVSSPGGDGSNFELNYTFESETQGSLSIVKDIFVGPVGNPFGPNNPYLVESPYSSGSRELIPGGTRSMTIKINALVDYDSMGKVSFKLDNSQAECKSDAGVLIPCPSLANDSEARSKYNFSGLTRMKGSSLFIDGSFSAKLINCDPTQATEISPSTFELTKEINSAESSTANSFNVY